MLVLIKRVKVKATCHIEILLNVARHNMQKQKKTSHVFQDKTSQAWRTRKKTALTIIKKEVI